MIRQKLISSTAIGSILAGISIGIAGAAYITIDSTIIGALFFTIGLFIICTNNFSLFTGKVCYSDHTPEYIFKLIVIWCGNFIGATIVAGLLLLAAKQPILHKSAMTICNAKLNSGLLNAFISSIFCNILIYIAVDGFKTIKDPVGKYIALFFGVSVFVICGFEHCVADMVYFALAGNLNIQVINFLLVVTAGNIVGGLLLPVCKKFL